MPDAIVRTLDGNQAVTSVAYRLSEVIAIYPITPSSSMGEESDELASKGTLNLWGMVPTVVEMQSEGGAAGAVHGALSAGALATTFTASQGLLLMIPNMYKIAGELTPFCMHVSARTLATHALSIFGDHSDVMACRQTGFAMLCSNSVQEAHDMAAIASASTLRARVPFLHFFDGFRTSHEVSKISMLPDEVLRGLVDETAIAGHRARSLSPDHPVLRGSAANPDSFFQAREACNGFYAGCPAIVAETMARFAELTGRRYGLVDYEGHPEADRVIVLMGSGAEVTQELVEHANARGEKLGVLKVRLYRPFPAAELVAALPRTVKAIAVLDRTKEPGAVGEPLYQDVRTALSEAVEEGALASMPRMIGGRYGLSSKEFTAAMVRAVYDELAKAPELGGAGAKRRFTVGIVDDVTHLSLSVDPRFEVEPDDVVRCVFYGLGADGTVGANKSSIKIIGEETDRYVQGYFVYDSKKSGAITISHLRFGPRPIRSSYLVKSASFVAVHQWGFFDRYDVLELAREGATLLVSSPHTPEETWNALPRAIQEEVLHKKIQVYTIDANAVARAAGMGSRINTIMQTCFFALSGIFEREEAIGYIKRSIEKTYRLKGAEVVQKNFAVVDAALSHLHRVPTPGLTSERTTPPVVSPKAPDFVQRVTAAMLAGKGDALPVSAFPVDGTWPTGTAKWEKRAIADSIPTWDEKVCIQCNKCAMVCPHAAVRVKVYDQAQLEGRPETFKSMAYKGTEWKGSAYTVQVAPEDCTGCGLCVEVCPGKDKANPRHKSLEMVPMRPLVAGERVNLDFFLNLPEAPRAKVKLDLKESQFFEPLFEYSGACSGCGETPYIKLVTQLFGDRTIIANATGCSSIYGGNLPTTPYTTNRDGRGPAWGNSLFEDNAEFGLGIRLGVDQQAKEARELVRVLAGSLPEALVTEILASTARDEATVAAQRERVVALRAALGAATDPRARRLDILADYLVPKAVWIVGGDGWAYDIGYGGLDHVLASGANVNILVLDTEVYSNTGGQQSKATPLGAAAKFAARGKATPKKDLALLALTYGNVYVARVAFGAKDAQTVNALLEAESFDGPSIVIAYSHCIAHGYDLVHGLSQQKKAVETGYWPLFRFDPRRTDEGESALKLDSPAPKGKLVDHLRAESRFRAIELEDPDRFQHLASEAQAHVITQYALYESLAHAMTPAPKTPDAAPPASTKA
ncbi:MAG: pyruvate:ferredoxin (flavodoxin) oxidoreductase [Sandaracinaceae bacterium]|nr:pyruvate:ferredoxin (flavodoxin) oxidoreductase [Sandaracinaceae bacterium]